MYLLLKLTKPYEIIKIIINLTIIILLFSKYYSYKLFCVYNLVYILNNYRNIKYCNNEYVVEIDGFYLEKIDKSQTPTNMVDKLVKKSANFFNISDNDNELEKLKIKDLRHTMILCIIITQIINLLIINYIYSQYFNNYFIFIISRYTVTIILLARADIEKNNEFIKITEKSNIIIYIFFFLYICVYTMNYLWFDTNDNLLRIIIWYNLDLLF
jgi:hypothetical protein